MAAPATLTEHGDLLYRAVRGVARFWLWFFFKAYFAGIGRLRRQLQLGVLSVTRAHAARRLLAEREALIAELDRARDEHLAATRETRP